MCASTPEVSCTCLRWREGSASHRSPTRGEPHRLPGSDTVDRPPGQLACEPAPSTRRFVRVRPVYCRTPRAPDHPLKDGLRDPGDIEAGLRVELRMIGFSSPAVKHRPSPAQLLPGPGDSDDLQPAAALPQRLPEAAVLRTELTTSVDVGGQRRCPVGLPRRAVRPVRSSIRISARRRSPACSSDQHWTSSSPATDRVWPLRPP